MSEEATFDWGRDIFGGRGRGTLYSEKEIGVVGPSRKLYEVEGFRGSRTKFSVVLGGGGKFGLTRKREGSYIFVSLERARDPGGKNGFTAPWPILAR